MIFRRSIAYLFSALSFSFLLFQSATVAAASPPPAPIWSGVYAGIHGGYASGDISYLLELPQGPLPPERFDHSSSDWFGGAHIGVQHQFRNFVVGLELGYSGLSLADTAESQKPGYFRQVEINDLFVVGPRLGYATDRWMAYVKGGYASAEVDTRVYKNNSSGSTTSGRESGWMLGAGLEVLAWRGFVLGVDYSYVRLDMDDRAGTLPDTKPFTYSDVDNDIHTVTVRLSYLFGGPREKLHDPLK